jgi:hypothetical protein
LAAREPADLDAAKLAAIEAAGVVSQRLTCRGIGPAIEE